MKILSISKDGGEKSRVWGLFIIEWKILFSIVFLWFKDGSREAYHSHAFHAISWLLWGRLEEHDKDTGEVKVYTPSFRPIFTARDKYHKVYSRKNSWVISFRGPWRATWKEHDEVTNEEYVLSNGRVRHPKTWTGIKTTPH